MRSPSQIEASRRNGAKSKGPITDEGKSRSSLNGITHGLAGSAIVLEGESQEKWQELLAACIQELQPETELERELVDEIAAARWRIRRCRTVETAMINRHIAGDRENIANAYQSVDYSLRHAAAIENTNLALIDRYDVRVRRSYDRAVKNFYELRDRRYKSAQNTILPSEPKNDF